MPQPCLRPKTHFGDPAASAATRPGGIHAGGGRAAPEEGGGTSGPRGGSSRSGSGTALLQIIADDLCQCLGVAWVAGRGTGMTQRVRRARWWAQSRLGLPARRGSKGDPSMVPDRTCDEEDTPGISNRTVEVRNEHLILDEEVPQLGKRDGNGRVIGRARARLLLQTVEEGGGLLRRGGALLPGEEVVLLLLKQRGGGLLRRGSSRLGRLLGRGGLCLLLQAAGVGCESRAPQWTARSANGPQRAGEAGRQHVPRPLPLPRPHAGPCEPRHAGARAPPGPR